jgi:hypothetical protein
MKNWILGIALIAMTVFGLIFEPVQDSIDLIAGATSDTYQTEIDIIAGASEPGEGSESSEESEISEPTGA